MAINKDNDLSLIAKAAAAKSSSYKELSVRRKMETAAKNQKGIKKGELTEADKEALKAQLNGLPDDAKKSWGVLFDKVTDTKEAAELLTKISAYSMARKKNEEKSNRRSVIISFSAEE